MGAQPQVQAPPLTQPLLQICTESSSRGLVVGSLKTQQFESLSKLNLFWICLAKLRQFHMFFGTYSIKMFPVLCPGIRTAPATKEGSQ